MAQLLHPKKTSFFDDDGLSPDEEIQIRNDLGKLTTALIKAILQASFYKTEHKLTHAAVNEFFEALEPLKELFLELTYITSADDAKPDFQIEGIMVEPVNLNACIKSVLRDEFLGKLRDFFNWNKLVSFSIKREMDRQELLGFLAFTRRKVADKGASALDWDDLEGTPLELAGNRLSDVLVENGLFTISAICRDEIVFVDRKLPWRVKLALGRLMKNLKDIPLYAKATHKQIEEVQALLLQEIIRPLRGQDLLMEFLFNCDLVSKVAASDMPEFDIEGQVLTVLVRPQLMSVSDCFLTELERLSREQEPNTRRIATGVSLLKKCAIPLSDMLDEETMEVFRRATKGGFMTQEELPENVQGHIELEKEVDKFLANPEPVLEKIQGVADLEGFRRYASNTALMVSVLIRRKEFKWARQLVDLTKYLADAPVEAQARIRTLARDSLDSMATKENFQRMIKSLPDLRPQDQEHVFALCKTFRSKAVPELVSELRTAMEDDLRASIRAVLEQMGQEPQVAEFLRSALERPKQRWEYYRDFLLIMGGLRDPDSYQLANQFLGAEEPQIRQAAFTAVTRIGQRKAERDLVRGLMDPDLGVRRAVVLHLGEIGSRSTEYRDFLTRLFSGALSPGLWNELMAVIQRQFDKIQLANHQLLNSGASALAHLLESGVMSMAEVESRMCKVLNSATKYHLFAGGEAVVKERDLLIKTLVGIMRQRGTAECIPALRQAQESPSGDIHHQAKAAIRQVAEREDVQETAPWKERAIKWIKLFLGLQKEDEEQQDPAKRKK